MLHPLLYAGPGHELLPKRILASAEHSWFNTHTWKVGWRNLQSHQEAYNRGIPIHLCDQPDQEAFPAEPCSVPGLATGLRGPVRENAKASYYRARYYDPTAGRFLGEDNRETAPLSDLVNLYAYVLGNPVNFSDPLGLFTMKSGSIPWPNLRLQALLECIELKTGLSLVVTSTTEPPPLSPHGPDDPHRRDGGLAVDIRYPFDPEFVLHAAVCCGAKNALDEKRHPSIHSTAKHIHLQLVPGPNPSNPGGDLPRNVKCGCS